MSNISTAEGVSYHQNEQSKSHVFQGTEEALRGQIQALKSTVDDEPKHHVVTRVLLTNANKDVYGPTGGHIGFLVPPKFGNGWMLVVKEDAL